MDPEIIVDRFDALAIDAALRQHWHDVAINGRARHPYDDATAVGFRFARERIAHHHPPPIGKRADNDIDLMIEAFLEGRLQLLFEARRRRVAGVENEIAGGNE